MDLFVIWVAFFFIIIICIVVKTGIDNHRMQEAKTKKEIQEIQKRIEVQKKEEKKRKEALVYREKERKRREEDQKQRSLIIQQEKKRKAAEEKRAAGAGVDHDSHRGTGSQLEVVVRR